MVALRSFDWLRIGVVAVRETYVGHLEAHGLHAAADDLGGDRVDGRVRREMRPRLPGQPHEIDVRHGGSPRPDVSVRSVVRRARKGAGTRTRRSSSAKEMRPVHPWKGHRIGRVTALDGAAAERAPTPPPALQALCPIRSLHAPAALSTPHLLVICTDYGDSRQ